MWALVFVYFFEVTPFVELVSVHRSMNECFQAREVLSIEHGKGNGYFEAGHQAVCINMDEST